MFDHIGFVVEDLARARRVYDACTGALGLQTIENDAGSFLIVADAATAVPFIWIGVSRPSFWSKGLSPSASPIHLCFKAGSRDAVDDRVGLN
jgi:catechol 2,3-dioxygenase-like lactoylglutathione lyase family enzyme